MAWLVPLGVMRNRGSLCLMVVGLVSLFGAIACGPQQAAGPGDFDKISVETVTPGTGPKAADGDLLYVRYTGRLKTGVEFDSNINKPGRFLFAVKLGGPGVIAGWNQGLKDTQKGGKYKIQIPSFLGYGEEGRQPSIPPKAGLEFDLEVVDLIPAAELETLVVDDITKGSGPVAAEGDTVSVHYVGKYLDGTVFDDSRKRNAKPDQFKIGKRQAIPGIDWSVRGMSVGSKRRIKIPPALGWGEQGFQGVEPNQVLIYEVEMVAITKG